MKQVDEKQLKLHEALKFANKIQAEAIETSIAKFVTVDVYA